MKQKLKPIQKYRRNFARCQGYLCAHREFCVRWLAFMEDKSNKIKYPEVEYPRREYCRISQTEYDRSRSINIIDEKHYLKED